VTFDINPLGTILRYPRYERVQSRRSAAVKILRALGLIRVKQRVKRLGELASPFEFALVSGAEAERVLDEIGRLRTDCTPVILGDPETAATILASDDASPGTMPAEPDRIDLDHWIAERLANFKQEYEIEPPHGPWPEAPRPATGELKSVLGLRGGRDFLPEIVIALVPTTEPALLAPYLRYGDWNECPSAAVHTAVARRWSKAYGATPVAFAGDVVEYRVARPVSTQERAMDLALEQFAFCPDIVLQGTETLERLAAEILGARRWFFWWD
jgi:Domain of unknown function (DUF4253)